MTPPKPLEHSKDPRIFIDPAASRPKSILSVLEPTTWLRSAGRPSAPVGTQLIYGEQFAVHAVKRGWAFGQVTRQWMAQSVNGAALPGYVGYVKAAHLAPQSAQPTHIVTALKAPVFQSPDIKSPIKALLPLNAILQVRDQRGDFVQTALGFIHANHVAALTRFESSDRSDFVTKAEAHLGLPYIWGGVSSDGLDCSGLVQSSLRACAGDAPRDSDQQAAMGNAVNAMSELKRGDLVFWKGHVGIMRDASRLLHANGYHMKVVSEPLAVAIERIKKSAGPVTALRRI